jgi:hypothetical protein
MLSGIGISITSTTLRLRLFNGIPACTSGNGITINCRRISRHAEAPVNNKSGTKIMDIKKASKLAVENIFKEGLTDIFPAPQELSVLKNELFRKRLIVEVEKSIKGGTLESLDINPISHVLLPKGGPFDFRRCALMQPLDTIKYLALALSLSDEIEKCRPSNSKRMIFSYRLRPHNGYIFDPKYNITSFKKHISNKSKSKKTKILVSCDIANYYDRLNLHRLESVLLSIGLDKTRVSQLNHLLLFWANRDSYGLPVGSNASRILAEAALLDVDKYLMSIGANFCRFVDDYRFFAPDAHTAHHWLTQLIERLWLEGLTINKSKTKIEDVSKLNLEENDSVAIPAPKKQKTKIENEMPEPQFRLVAGYGGIIPTKFRTPTSKELEKLKDSDPEAIFNDLKSKQIPSPEDILEFVKSVLSVNKLVYFKHLPALAELFPQFTPYIVDVLIKHSDEIPEKQSISECFSKRLHNTKYLPEYIAISIVRLLGASGFEDKDTLFDFFRNLRRTAGAYIGRALLDSLENLVSRSDVLEIRNYFSRADAWEKRQIVRIVDKHLHEEEKRPWLKNIKTTESRDLFTAELINKTKKQ